MGPFVEAWLRVHGSSARTRREARERFVAPLLQLAQRTGGHLPELADAEAPHRSRGCPAQAWSVSEILRLERSVLAPETSRRRTRRAAPASAAAA
jgi:glycogen debranching enzyme